MSQVKRNPISGTDPTEAYSVQQQLHVCGEQTKDGKGKRSPESG